MPSPTLDLFGVLHVDRPGKVRAELDDFADDADALFIEQPETEVTLGTFGRTGLRAPVFLLGALLHLALFTPFYAVLNREYDEAEAIAVRRIADERGLPVHEVDDHPVLYMSRAGPRWIVANWLALAGLAWAFGVSFLAIAGVLLLAGAITIGTARLDRRLWLVVSIPATWGGLLLAGTIGLLPTGVLAVVLLFYLATAGSLNEHRNRHMLRNIADIADREEYDHACLVTGKGHLAGLVSLAGDRDLAVSRMHVSRWLRRSDDVTDDPDPERVGENSGLGWFRTAFGLTRPDARPSTETEVLGRRTLAAVLDLAGVVVATFVGGVVLGAVAALALGESALSSGLLVGFAVSPVLYFVVWETLLGRTPGKWLLGLVVVAEDGSVPSRRALLVRNLLRPLDFVPFYALGLVSVLATDRAQRVGDLLADTVVVRTE
ncbi:RDD family protein [Halorussus lipolyticus]|uniref:RDD family protein n=1 Tax=Halorussus lipolyticus TaxID=3034024 RepID=UPI0023E8674E|nr:RDD family protein [Halorussus sp. DT80]